MTPWCSPSFLYVQQVGERGLSRPVKIELETGEDVGFTAFAPILRVGGVGDTAGAAIFDLLSSARALRDSLDAEDARDLDPSAIRLRDRLKAALG